MTRTTIMGLNVPNLEIVDTKEEIASCNCCGVQNYVAVHTLAGRNDYKPTGTKLWDVRISPNGYQTFVTKFCRACLFTFRDKIEDTITE